MKKILQVMVAIFLFFPVLFISEYCLNSVYALSFVRHFYSVKHPNDSILMRWDSKVANCGDASNQCCYAFIQFRKSGLSSQLVKENYESLTRVPNFLQKEKYELFFMDKDEDRRHLSSYYSTKSSLQWLDLVDVKGVYAITYAETDGNPGLDFRCR